ncbi:alpha/beta hydrolase family protein [Arenicella xantha]|nr:S9 family peptidase [Arenicella xantha]
MRSILLTLSLLTLVNIDSVLAEEADTSRLFTSERVFDLEYADDPQISPDGRFIVYARKSMSKLKDRVVSDLWIIDTKNGTQRPLISGQGSSSSARWSPNGDRLLYVTSTDGKPDLRVRFMDTGESFSVAQLEHSPSRPVWSPDAKSIAFTMFVPSQGLALATAPKAPEQAEWAEPVKVIDDLTFRFDGAGYLKKGHSEVFTVSAQGGTPRRITTSDNGLSGVQWLGNDQVVVAGNEVEDAELDPIESEIYQIDLGTLALTALTQRDGPDRSPAVSPNGRSIAYLGYDDKLKAYQQTDLYVMPADGSEPKNLTQDFDRSISSIAWRPDGKGILAQVGVDGEIHLISIDLAGNRSTLATDVGGTSFGRPYGSGSFSVASNGGSQPKIAYTKASTERPAEVAMTTGAKQSKTMTDLNSDVLDYLDMAKIEEISVKSRHDQRDIEAWVALPPGFKADGTYPMILEIHGGPFAMYGPFFGAEIQRYAAQGYVTVYVNPRGSTGYGEEFAQLIDLAYPGNDHDDLMSVVDELISKQYVSDKRLFITGGSGGGVLTAWAVGKTQRFAAAATVKPVINWTSMALSADIARFVSRHWLRAQPWEDPELYWRLSPLSLVGNVKTPTLVMVGEADWRTPAWEAEQFYTALKVQKVDTALVRVPGASHLIAARPSQLIAKVDNIMAWFAKYDLKPEDAGSSEQVTTSK